MKALPLVLILIAFVLGACGKNNESGKKSSSGRYYGALNIPGSTPSTVSSLIGQIVSMPCQYGTQKQHVQFPINRTVAVGALYLGVTSEGDVATVTSQNGQGLFSAYICPRPGATGGQLLSNPIVGISYAGCLVNEITEANVALPPGYLLRFRAIHFGLPNINVSQICRGY